MIAADHSRIIAALYEHVISNEGFSGALRAMQGVFGMEQMGAGRLNFTREYAQKAAG